jgi:hypothetical protein
MIRPQETDMNTFKVTFAASVATLAIGAGLVAKAHARDKANARGRDIEQRM